LKIYHIYMLIRVWMCLEDSNLITYLYFQIGGPKVLKNDLDLQWLYVVALFLSLIIYQLPNLARWYSEQKKWLLPTNNFIYMLIYVNNNKSTWKTYPSNNWIAKYNLHVLFIVTGVFFFKYINFQTMNSTKVFQN
jgi:hypothetical protein